VADYATRVTIDPFRICNKEITITGSMAVLHSYERAAELFAAGVLDPGATRPPCTVIVPAAVAAFSLSPRDSPYPPVPDIAAPDITGP